MQFQVGDLVRTTYKNFLFPKGSLGLVTEVLMHGDCGGPYPVMTVRMFVPLCVVGVVGWFEM